MSPEVMGVEMNASIGRWNADQRRTGSILLGGVALLLVAVGVLTWFFARDAADTMYWALVGVLILVLLAQLAVILLGVMADRRPRAHAEPHAGPAAPAAVAPVPAAAPATRSSSYAPAVRQVRLRCGDCGNVFEVTDTGERPLHHLCPGCGAEGVLRDHNDPPAVDAAPAPAAAPVRRLKLRCNGCEQIFEIEDHGERELSRPCPHCGRIGQIR